jgi:hypothetical protein
MPVEVMGRPSRERFMDAALDVDFEDVPLQDALDYISDIGFRTRIVCSEHEAREFATA